MNSATPAIRRDRRRFPFGAPRRRKFLAVLCLALAAGGCEIYDQFATSLLAVSPAQEVELGRQVRAEIEKDLEFVTDPEVVGYVRGLGAKVAAASPEAAAFPTEFHVVKDPSINAFAVPGGAIYVHTGLIDAAEDEAELAGVLAHEYGHVVYRHGAKHLSRAMGAELLQSLALGTDSGEAARLLAGVVSQGALTHYSRQDELEADSIAVPTLYQASLDPNAMVTFFQRLEQAKGGSGGGLTRYFSTHPATSDRISSVQADIATLPPGRAERPVNDLRRVQSRLRKLGLSGP